MWREKLYYYGNVVYHAFKLLTDLFWPDDNIFKTFLWFWSVRFENIRKS